MNGLPEDVEPNLEGPLTAIDVEVVKNFFCLLHSSDRGGVLEARLIAPGGGPRIGFFDDAAAFADVCRECDGQYQIYAGVRPRHRDMLRLAPNQVRPLRNGGQKSNIDVVATTVIDIDPVRTKDTASTNAELALAMEVAERIRSDFAAMGWPAPIRAMSGNGVHVFFSFPPVHITDAAHRDVVELKLKTFEAWVRTKYTVEGIKVDSIADLPRIIKVTGTMSIKGDDTPERPWRRSYFIDEPKRVENPLFWEFAESLPAPDEKKSGNRSGKGLGSSDIVIGEAPSPAVMKAVQGHKDRRAHWEGRGKPAANSDGTPGDTSRTGYDWTVALDLIRAGIKDPSELATALARRPNGGALEKGAGYVLRTVERALASFSKGDDDDSSCSLHFVRATMTSSNPKIFELVFEEGAVEISAEELSNRHKFETAALNALGQLPVIKLKGTQWAEIVNEWLADATIKELPPEASAAFQLEQAIYQVIADMSEGETVGELDFGAYVRIEGRRAFKPRGLIKRLGFVPGATAPKTHEVCAALERLGCTKVSPYIEGKRVRVYVEPATWPAEFTGGAQQEFDPNQLLLPWFATEGTEQIARA